MSNEPKQIVGKLSNLDLTQWFANGNVLLVTGKHSFEASTAKEQLSALINEASCFHIDNFSKNPNIDDLRRLLPIVQSIAPKTIIAIGGGSCLDIAKLLKLFVHAPEDPLSYVQQVDLLKNLASNTIELVAIPTTAGSGSEATEFAVLYGEQKEKYSVSRNDIRPQTVIHDASLTYSQSPYQSACSGLDCLVQAIESFWSKRATALSRDYAQKAIAIAKENVLAVVQSPNEKNRSLMQQAAYNAGAAINISKTTAPHAFSYYLTTHYDVPHGHAVALLMRYFLLYHHRYDVNEPIFKEISNLLGVRDLNEAHALIDTLLKECQLETNILSYISSHEIYNDFFASVNIERLDNHPVAINKEAFREVLYESVN